MLFQIGQLSYRHRQCEEKQQSGKNIGGKHLPCKEEGENCMVGAISLGAIICLSTKVKVFLI